MSADQLLQQWLGEKQNLLSSQSAQAFILCAAFELQ